MQESSNLDLILNSYYENKCSHAFLVETNNIDGALTKIKEIVEILLKDIPNIKHKIEMNNLMNLKIICPDGQFIKKEQIIQLKKDFKTMPVYAKYNIYIIVEAEKMNNSAGNTLLKFLEEPEENIIGFLLTANKQGILETISSRCQKLKFMTKNSDIKFAHIEKFINILDKSKNDALLYAKLNLVDLIKTREDAILFFQSLFSFYENNIDKYDDEKVIRKLRLIEEKLYQLNYNVSIFLLIESFIIESEVQH